MAFKIKKLNHTPAWYREHCNGEDGGSAAFRAMLNNDMAYIGADNDSNLCYEEKIGPYEERWNAIFSNWKSEDPNGVRVDAMTTVMECETKAGFRTSKQFKDEPFSIIDELMNEAGIDEKVIRQFLAWRNRRNAIEKTEKKKVKKQTSKRVSPIKAAKALKHELSGGHQFFG